VRQLTPPNVGTKVRGQSYFSNIESTAAISFMQSTSFYCRSWTAIFTFDQIHHFFTPTPVVLSPVHIELESSHFTQVLAFPKMLDIAVYSHVSIMIFVDYDAAIVRQKYRPLYFYALDTC
tara:strand:+ start:40 stop:399 length:360 start_codon:yes stop_codon:yes gene_type:complete